MSDTLSPLMRLAVALLMAFLAPANAAFTARSTSADGVKIAVGRLANDTRCLRD